MYGTHQNSLERGPLNLVDEVRKNTDTLRDSDQKQAFEDYESIQCGTEG